MKAIGGYPELELRKGDHYHKDAIKLNTARNCLEYILIARKYKKVYLPYYTCEAVFEPFKKSSTGFPEMAFYHIDNQLDPIELPELKEEEAFLYTNYFGLKQETVGKLVEKYGNKLILDNSQAFYDMPYPGIDTFYSARKFFGVPDGAYLYTDAVVEESSGVSELETDTSYDRFDALLKRIDLSAEEGYGDFQKTEESLSFQPIKGMSKLTEAILRSIDYDGIRNIRRRNYRILYDILSLYNNFQYPLTEEAVPLCFPFFSTSSELRSRLIRNRIFVPTYWPNVIEQSHDTSFEYDLANRLLPLPIDQRYERSDMERIGSIISEKTDESI